MWEWFHSAGYFNSLNVYDQFYWMLSKTNKKHKSWTFCQYKVRTPANAYYLSQKYHSTLLHVSQSSMQARRSCDWDCCKHSFSSQRQIEVRLRLLQVWHSKWRTNFGSQLRLYPTNLYTATILPNPSVVKNPTPTPTKSLRLLAAPTPTPTP